MKPLQELSISQKAINHNFLMAGFMLIMGILMVVTSGFFTLIGFAILFFIIAAVNSNIKIVKIYDDFLEIKLGAIASKKFIKYNQITKFNKTSKFLEIHCRDEQDRYKKVKIPAKVLEEEDIQELNDVLMQKTNLEESNYFVST
ncbi:hypothetical protein [Aquimarina sp. SS2-1]|uniref:hypothetical protein n=1 Tax=Aquimarina besae TaxID=3342247 RepID=UPI0036735043